KVRNVVGHDTVEKRSDPTAYCLVLRPKDYLDLSQFNKLNEDASALVVEGDLAGAVKAFDRALQLWNGNPARGLDFNLLTDANFLRTEATFDSQYAEMRLTWADSLIKLGETHRMHDVLDQLDRLANSGILSEYDERLWRLRSGAHILCDNVSLAIDLF